MAVIANREEVVERVLERLADGQSLVTICADASMPNAATIWRWAQGNDDLGARIREAREIGYILRAERVVNEVRTCADPLKARAILAAEQWYLGKLSIALADKPVVGVAVNVDNAGFSAIAGALEQLAAARASGRNSTRTVVIEGEARSADPAGGLADLAGDGGQGLG